MPLFMRSRANNPLSFCYHSPATQPPNRPVSHPPPNHQQHSARCGCFCFCPCPPPLNFYLICRLRKLIVCLLLSVKTMENILATVTLRRERIRRRPPKTLGPKVWAAFCGHVEGKVAKMRLSRKWLWFLVKRKAKRLAQKYSFQPPSRSLKTMNTGELLKFIRQTECFLTFLGRLRVT